MDLNLLEKRKLSRRVSKSNMARIRKEMSYLQMRRLTRSTRKSKEERINLKNNNITRIIKISILIMRIPNRESA